jgi:hypothetical protein
MNAVSIIMGFSSKGGVFFTVNRGSNNGQTIWLFLMKLAIVLGSRGDPHWRDHTTLMLDNASYHHGTTLTAKLARAGLKVQYLGPYQFRM